MPDFHPDGNHALCAVTRRNDVDGPLFVCECECLACKRRWADAAKPLVRDGIVVRRDR